MRHLLIAAALYAAVAAELAGVRLPGGMQFWWLDIVILLAIQLTSGISTQLWLTAIGFLSDVFGWSPAGVGTLTAATAGFAVGQQSSQRGSEPVPVSPIVVALGLLIWHACTSAAPASPNLFSLPLSRSILTLALAGLMQWHSASTEISRRTSLIEATR
ncbi:MAG: hypothetical protein KDA66_15660 [Planctomycetaceae bacterium]|nr:hypothetical protein [Planctomycetaceae bacterium]